MSFTEKMTLKIMSSPKAMKFSGNPIVLKVIMFQVRVVNALMSPFKRNKGT